MSIKIKRFHIVTLTAALCGTIFTPTIASASLTDSVLKMCIEGRLPEGESNNLIDLIEKTKVVQSRYGESAIAICYTKLTGKESVFIQGEGVVYGDAAEIKSNRDKELIDLRCKILDEISELHSAIAASEAGLKEYRSSLDDRKSEARIAIAKECFDWAKSDRRAALTNTVCSSVFLEGGLPNSDVGGLTSADALDIMATAALAAAEIEIKKKYLEIIVRQKLTPEEWLAKQEVGNAPETTSSEPEWLKRPNACE